MARRLHLLFAALLTLLALAPGSAAADPQNRVGASSSAAPHLHPGAQLGKLLHTRVRSPNRPGSRRAAASATKAGPRTSFDALSQSAAASYKGQEISVAGWALQKHGGRSGSAFPGATGSPQVINRQAQAIVDEVLRNPARTRTSFFNPRLNERVVDIQIPGGRGLRYGESGGFRGFLEPRR